MVNLNLKNLGLRGLYTNISSATGFMSVEKWTKDTENTARRPDDGLLLGQRRRRWAVTRPALGQRLQFLHQMKRKYLY